MLSTNSTAGAAWHVAMLLAAVKNGSSLGEPSLSSRLGQGQARSVGFWPYSAAERCEWFGLGVVSAQYLTAHDRMRLEADPPSPVPEEPVPLSDSFVLQIGLPWPKRGAAISGGAVLRFSGSIPLTTPTVVCGRML